MKIDFLFWNVERLTGGQFSLGWNWGWGYYRALKDMGIAGYGGVIDGYKHTPSDVVIITDGIQICLRNEPKINEAFFSKIKKDGKKLVIIIYESIFANDSPLVDLKGGKNKDFMYLLRDNPKWKALINHADLIVCADPHDVHTINTKPEYSNYPKTIYLPLAIDEKTIKPIQNRIWKACFIGSIWVGNRRSIIKPLANRGLLEIPEMNHRGNDYNTALTSTNNYNKIAGKYAINLNVRTLFSGLQLRIYEAMAMGRVCLSHKPTILPGRENLCKDLKNVLWYDKPSEIGHKLEVYLKNHSGMTKIGKNARDEVVANHTHTHRIKSILANL